MMKNLKHSFLLLTILLLTFSTVKGQLWSSPQALTFTEANKCNLYMNFTDACENGEHWLLLWEQPVDSNSTAIYCQFDLLNTEPLLLLSDSMVHYRDPQSFYIQTYSDSLFYVFYEKAYQDTNQLCYIKVATDGGHSNPIVLAENTSTPFYYYLDEQKVAWVSNNFLLFSFMEYYSGNIDILPPDTLLQGNISDVIIHNNEVYCINNDEGQDKIILFEWENFVWNSPVELASGAEIKSLESINSANYTWDDYPLIAWTFRENDMWHITLCESISKHYLDTLNIKIRIFDISGKLKLETIANDTEIMIQTQSWPRGIYMVNIVDGQQQLSQKIILE